MFLSRSILIAAGMAALLLSTPAWSTSVLPVATSGTQCNSSTDPNPTTNPLLCSVLGAAASVSEAPYPAVVTHATATDVYAGSATAALNYSFEVVGGSPGDMVPLIITTDLLTDASSTLAGSEAMITISTFAGLTQALACSGSASCAGGAMFYGNLATSARSGDVDSLALFAEASVGYLQTNSADASADPLIEVNPTFANAGLYSIVLSPGVANAVNAVPEPTTASFLILATAALVATRLRRHP